MIRAAAAWLGVASILLTAAPPIDRRTLREVSGPVGPRPGVYQIRPLSGGGLQCLGHQSGAVTRENFLGIGGCDEREARIVVQPHPVWGFSAYTLRTTDEAQVRLGLCATVARDVILGPAAIDVRACQSPGDAAPWRGCSSMRRVWAPPRLPPSTQGI